MFYFSILFLSGILLLQLFTTLPPLYISIIILIYVTIQLFFLKKYHHYLKWLIPFLLGFAWSLYYAHHQLLWHLPNTQEGKPLKITGIISSIPDTQPTHTSFRFYLQRIQFENDSNRAHANIQLSWQSAPKNLHVGDTWQFTVNLKNIHSLINPGGFDVETWSFQEGIRASGYVINKQGLLLASHVYHHPIDRIREYFKTKMNDHLSKSATSHWITALAIGERDGIPVEDWQVLRNTGTNHLMAIAGLHIGFMSGFAFSIVMWIWRRQPKWVLKMPAQHAGAIAALIVGMIYSAMAGFSLPTQRACLMLSLCLITVLSRRKIVSWHTWSLALLCVLLFNPLSVLSVSFWLSFSSIALIIYGMRGRLATTGLWWKHGRIQWVLTVGLIPLSIGLFQECSWVSFIANSIAIPCVGFLVVPLTLLGCFSLLIYGKLGGIFLGLADKILSCLWVVLSYLSHISWGTWYQLVPHVGYVIIACIGMIFLLLPSGFPGRGFGIIWLLPLMLYKPPTPPVGDVWLTLLDVGQGLSAVVQTHHHILVFDTGSRLSEKNDMGVNVVVPFLHSIGATHIDKLVISHGDNDHIGGASAILKEFSTFLVQSSVPEKFLQIPASYCIRGESWQWDQVTFKFLYPTFDKLGLNNDSSCVLRVTSGLQQVLLTGDIEKMAETDLVQSVPAELAADVLIAPHHGSKTSALDEFIALVHPKIVLFPVGYRNRYHFPHPSVMQKYHDRGTLAFDSVQSGAIQLKISKQARVVPIIYREAHNHYWQPYQPL